MNVWHFLANADSERVALRQQERAIDYADARRQALALAAAIAARGVRPGDRVACLMHNCIEHYLAYFATAAAGAIFVSLNTRLTAPELHTILSHSGAGLVLHDGDHAASANELGIATLAVDDHLNPIGEPFEPTLAAADAPAQLYYTSGTTGDPKGVVLTHANVCTHAESAIAELGLDPRDRWAHIAPMFHLADAWATFALTAVSGTHVFLPRFSATTALDLLADEGITITNLVPTMLNLMVKEPDAADRRFALRAMLSGGAPIAPEVVERILATFRCDYVQTYGMTETSPYLTLSLPTAEVEQLPPTEQLRMKCRTGRPFRGVELRVTADDGHEIPRDDRAVGEIRVRGATVTPGYWQNPEATAAAFDGDGFLKTGDLATIDRFGYVNIVDRKKDVVKTGGELVYSIEVENALYEHPAVLECAVFGVPDETWGERVTAAVALRPDQHAEAAELIEFCRERIAAYKAPKEVRFIDALPRTGSGKISKRALRDAPKSGT
ncbi:MAG: AMP-binding protein [bacterium]|nr:AMP-binding protein [bacterium]